MNKLVSATLVSVCIAAFAATAAVAQTTPDRDYRSASDSGKTLADRAFARPTERVEARLAYLKTALKITDAQHSLWDAYANLLRKNAQDMEQRFQSKRTGKPEGRRQQRPNAIERLERAQSFHASAITRLNQLLTVQKPLYAALSPEQQKIADVVRNRRGRFMERPSMRGRGAHGRG